MISWQWRVGEVVGPQDVKNVYLHMLDEKSISLVPIVNSDLRVDAGIQFSFTYTECRTTVGVALDWILSASNSVFDPFQPEELQALHLKYGGEFRPVRCNKCQALYLVREEIKETSMCAYRIKIDAVWKVSEPIV